MSEKREVTIEGGFFLENILYSLNKIKYKFSTLWAFFFFGWPEKNFHWLTFFAIPSTRNCWENLLRQNQWSLTLKIWLWIKVANIFFNRYIQFKPCIHMKLTETSPWSHHPPIFFFFFMWGGEDVWYANLYSLSLFLHV